MVFTVDLFLDLEPFARRQSNQWGCNVAPKWISEVLEMDLSQGNRAELLGYDEFSPDRILDHADDYATGKDRHMAQLMVFS